MILERNELKSVNFKSIIQEVRPRHQDVIIFGQQLRMGSQIIVCDLVAKWDVSQY